MVIYLDSSALVKRYVEEDGSEKVNLLLGRSRVVSLSKLAYPEILSAFARRYRGKEISKHDFLKSIKSFEDDWDFFSIIEVQEELLPIMKLQIERHFLKGADSVHLASALWLKKVLKENITFIASDNHLLRAAKIECLTIINPEKDEV